MDKPQNNWPDTAKARNLLFVAQAIKQLTSIDSFESFRMMTMDTVTRIEEAKRLVKDIIGGFSRNSFEPVAAELCWSLENDPVVDHQQSDQIAHALKYFQNISLNEKTDMFRIHSKLDVLSAKIAPTYKRSLEQFVISNYNNSVRRREVISALSFYLSHLVNRGYSRQHIHDVSDEMFFLEDIGRVTDIRLRNFFDKFDLSTFRVEVYFQLDDTALSYLKDVSDISIVDIDDLPNEVLAAYALEGLSIHTDGNFVKAVRNAKDLFGAAREINDELATISAVSVLSAWEFEFSMPREFACFVRKRKIARAYTIGAIDGGSSVKIAPSSARGIKDSKEDTNNIRRSFESKSIERLNNSISTVHAALEDNNYDSRLISLWSSFESLLSAPPHKTVRIMHYVEVVTPCILATYFERNALAVYNKVILNQRSDFVKILDKVGDDVGDDRATQFYALVFDDKFSSLRGALVRVLSGNPLLMFRFENLVSKFSTPELYSRSVESHRLRVEWQLHRIYRARNQLVHAGRAPAYLEVLTVNAFEYYRNSIREVIQHATQLKGANDVDTVVESIGLRYASHLAYVVTQMKAKRFTTETMRKAFIRRG